MKYIVKYQENNKIKTKYLSEKQYLNKELPKNIISIKKSFEFFNLFKSKQKISNRVLIDILYELNLMLEANILFDEAFDILINSARSEQISQFLKSLKYSFSNHINISDKLKEFAFDSFIITLFKIIQDSGNPKKHINILYEILKEEEEVKRSIKKVFAYPLILVVSFIFALIGIFNYVVPKFESMFLQNDIKITLATKSLFFIKNLFEQHFFLLLSLVILLVFLIVTIYRRNEKLRYFLDKQLFLSLPLISQIYRYRILYRFFYLVHSLLLSRYEFNETINKCKTLINNKYFLDRITRIDSSLKSGKSIYQSFKKANIFDEVVLNIIKTAEISNSLEKTSYEIRTIYKKRFNEKVEIFSIFIEPIFFILIMALIVWLILAIFVPLWSIGDILRT